MKKLIKTVSVICTLIPVLAFSACNGKEKKSLPEQEDEVQFERPIEEEWRERQFPLLPRMPHSAPYLPKKAPIRGKLKPVKPFPIHPIPRPDRPTPLHDGES